jgi:hypothetical protein
MGDADLETVVTRFLISNNRERFLRELREEGHSNVIPKTLHQDLRKADARARVAALRKELARAEQEAE